MTTCTNLYLSRRHAVRLVAVPFALSVMGQAAVGKTLVETLVPYRTQLEVSLLAIPFRVMPSKLDLLSFEEQFVRDRVVMTARVHLHWPPGQRQRRFTVEAQDAQQAFERLERSIRGYFTRLG